MKRICPSCGTRYYDFQKNPPTCPVCSTAYDPEALLKSRRGRTAVVDEPAPKRKKAAAVVEDDLPDVADDLEVIEPDAEVEDGDIETPGVEPDDDTLLVDDDDDVEIEEVAVEPDEN
jgi:uncharacterized protein (TIGR02300 family)